MKSSQELWDEIEVEWEASVQREVAQYLAVAERSALVDFSARCVNDAEREIVRAIEDLERVKARLLRARDEYRRMREFRCNCKLLLARAQDGDLG